MGVLAPVSTEPSGEQSSKGKAAVAANPFTKAARRKTEAFYDDVRALTTSSQTLQQVEVPANGYLRHIVLDVALSGTTGATYKDDAPFSVIEQVQLSDVNGQPIVALTGFELFLANLIGRYSQLSDARKSPLFKQAADGARFQLRIPVEIIQRNALGALPNMNAAMAYKIKLVLAPQSEVYATNGTGAQVSIKATTESWSNPAGADVRGVPNTTTPPEVGLTQNWTAGYFNVVAGQNGIRLTRVGNTIRNIVLVNRDATGKRSDKWPERIQKFIDGNLWTSNSVDYDKQRMYELFELGTDLPTGVISITLTDDFDGTPGEEMGDYWLATTGATRFEIQGSWPEAGQLHVLTNDILATSVSGGPGATLGSV